MDYEKAYKEAQKWIESIYPDLRHEQQMEAEAFFPELKESEDEKIKKTLIHYVENWKTYNPNSPFDDYAVYTSDRDECDRILAWLEKQGTSYTKKDVDDAYVEGMAFAKGELEKQGEQKAAWSEEDEKMCQETIDWFEKKCFPYALENDNPARESIKWLKSLKDRVQPKQEWSDEDEDILNEVINHFDGIPLKHPTHEVIGWLVFIKQRITD